MTQLTASYSEALSSKVLELKRLPKLSLTMGLKTRINALLSHEAKESVGEDVRRLNEFRTHCYKQM